MFEVDTEDFSYLFRGGTSLRVRMYRPRGRGPFPAMVDGHGGAWIRGTLESNDPINRRLAAGGVIVMTIDYSLPPVGIYPSSVADMNYAVRWLKLNAEKYETKPEWVGVMGTSAGGHLAVLTAIKPVDLRYAALPLEGGSSIDARVRCVIALWPVICPYTRFQENVDRKARGDQRFATRAGAGLDQLKYWLTQEAMSDGSPMLALERGEDIEIPDILYIQAEGDLVHPRHCMDRFCVAYRKKDGHVETVLVEGEPDDLVRTAPESAEAKRAMKRMIEFIHESKARSA
ncbi:MAG TPA: alpha/beta hydrolase [Beijerinckiaceae bacterium]|nr:alpha/beta hydrolase [Beijerinckiaceae bacterium]